MKLIEKLSKIKESLKSLLKESADFQKIAGLLDELMKDKPEGDPTASEPKAGPAAPPAAPPAAAPHAEPDGDEPKPEVGEEESEDEKTLRAACPKGESESDEEYEAKIAKLKAWKTGKAEEPAPAPAPAAAEGEDEDEAEDEKKEEALKVAKDFRKAHPKEYQAIMENAKRVFKVRDTDIAGYKETIQNLRGELVVLKSLGEAERMLEEAEIGESVLSPTDLVTLSTEGKKKRIESMKKVLAGRGGELPAAGKESGKGDEIDYRKYHDGK